MPFRASRTASSKLLPFVEIQLGEIEIAFRETGIRVDRVLIRVGFGNAILQLAVELGQVEPRLVTRRRMQLDFLLVLGDGFLRMPALLGDEREVEVREPHVGFLRKRRANLPLGPRHVAALERDDAEGVARGDELRLDGDRLAELLPRLRRDHRDRAEFPPASSAPASSSDRARGSV